MGSWGGVIGGIGRLSGGRELTWNPLPDGRGSVGDCRRPSIDEEANALRGRAERSGGRFVTAPKRRTVRLQAIT